MDWLQDNLEEKAPAVINARIADVSRRDAGQLLGDYLAETRQPARAYSAAQLRQRGYVFSVSLAIQGSVGRNLALRWAMHRANDTRLRGATYNQLAGRVTPESESHSRMWPVWVPYPSEAGRYFVRFRLEDEKRQPVSERDTRRFVHRGERA